MLGGTPSVFGKLTRYPVMPRKSVAVVLPHLFLTVIATSALDVSGLTTKLEEVRVGFGLGHEESFDSDQSFPVDRYLQPGSQWVDRSGCAPSYPGAVRRRINLLNSGDSITKFCSLQYSDDKMYQ
jgi:hypothetical protein